VHDEPTVPLLPQLAVIIASGIELVVAYPVAAVVLSSWERSMIGSLFAWVGAPALGVACLLNAGALVHTRRPAHQRGRTLVRRLAIAGLLFGLPCSALLIARLVTVPW
jgi:uncharacterized membrane protein YedE/YeeE